MKNSKRHSKGLTVTKLWDWDDAVRVVPYLRSVVRSLREHWLEIAKAKRQLKRANDQKLPWPRSQFLEVERRDDELRRAQDRFEDALAELNSLEVFLVDPARGLAFLPFRQDDNLAWYVFDLSAEAGLNGWRFHEDPIETRRPLNGLAQPLKVSA